MVLGAVGLASQVLDYSLLHLSPSRLISLLFSSRTFFTVLPTQSPGANQLITDPALLIPWYSGSRVKLPIVKFFIESIASIDNMHLTGGPSSVYCPQVNTVPYFYVACRLLPLGPHSPLSCLCLPHPCFCNPASDISGLHLADVCQGRLLHYQRL